jgi:hypothetical protein
MSFKKMMLLASALAALVAFAAPAAASAHLEWYVTETPEDVTLTGEQALHVEGELLTSVGAPAPFGVNQGPCQFTFTGTAFNGAEGAEAEIETGSSTVSPTNPCPSGFGAACSIENVGFGGFPWHVSTETPDTVIIEEAEYTNTYSPGCTALPHEVTASGSLEGELTTVRNANGEDCINFVNAGPLFASTTPLYVNGEVCITQPLTLY